MISVMRTLLLFLTLLAAPASAQDLQGNDTASNWVNTHYSAFGIWKSICDERPEDGQLNQRCYIRWVDVFSGRPHFGGQFIFITPQEQGYEVEFGIEPGTLFAPNGFRIERDETVVWRTLWPGCLTGLGCRFDGRGADTIIAQMQQGGTFLFDFRDGRGVSRSLNWPLQGFPDAWADFQTQARARGLID